VSLLQDAHFLLIYIKPGRFLCFSKQRQLLWAVWQAASPIKHHSITQWCDVPTENVYLRWNTRNNKITIEYNEPTNSLLYNKTLI
jgi:hypothetical protein